jgi:hypothetical protein
MGNTPSMSGDMQELRKRIAALSDDELFEMVLRLMIPSFQSQAYYFLSVGKGGFRYCVACS